jgi:hypothetical protein
MAAHSIVTMPVVSHSHSQLRPASRVSRSQRFSPADNPQQDDNEGDYQKNVNETADGVGSDEAKQPQDEENDSNGIQHGEFPF